MVRHKISIHCVAGLWYVECLAPECEVWKPPRAGTYYGRTTWDAALAVGIAHQKNHENGIKGLTE